VHGHATIQVRMCTAAAESVRADFERRINMKEFEYTITDPVGIHARPAGLLVKEVKAHADKVTITNADGKSADAKKLLALMGLGIRKGDTIKVTVEGDTEDGTADAVLKFLQENL
jgi:phosphocarrier protein HPr